ncbi:phosphonate ABC transporter, permease protein PhnE [Phenylobacterium sp.]|jgi:phosphonate transport system permease protein|uniref:phosphonate ABC transporter, permease protein PhnE n=1 Tax=Phenylobacterium sp. TaxID=1871053 RepID=UPI002E2FD9AF|nr:phosphonate ABC transporter, permease protein PhnE [Phenylobacterium sp.]HEX2560257.1 phosphonate ABC transporter, permease protein PhnE [Phenylobacterium sp.]
MSDAVAEFEERRRRLLSRQRLQALVGTALFSLLLAYAFHRSAFFDSHIGGDPLGRIADFLQRMNPDLRAEALFEDKETQGSLAYWFYGLPRWLKLAWQTFEMAVLATVLGAAAGLLASFLCARNLMPIAAVRFAVRRTLEAIRTFPDLILALILVAAFGVGPLAGVLTLAISTMGSLGRLFAEINEEVDPRPLEGLRASGASLPRMIRYGVIPQALPSYASYLLIRLEGNLAGAAALGIVGAGGIGLELQHAIHYVEFDTYLAILSIIIGMIFALDLISEAIRHRLIGLARPK